VLHLVRPPAAGEIRDPGWRPVTSEDDFELLAAAYDHGHQWISVDFDTANPLSRPFWLKAGFRPAGYGVLRIIDGSTPGQPGKLPESAAGN
jgi:hypothetical protein